MIHIVNDRTYETYYGVFGWYWHRQLPDKTWTSPTGPYDSAGDAVEDVYADAENAQESANAQK